jgi:hypothetical protein
MKNNQKLGHYTLAAVLVALLFLIPIVYAATTTTTMTWVVPTNKSHTATYGAACSTSAFYFVESDANHDGLDYDGNATQVRPNSSTNGGAATKCQSSTLAPILITNNGNVTVNVDGNFSAGFSGDDTNMLLKVWMGTGSGCGAASASDGGDSNGLGGWEVDCSVTVATNPVTIATCRHYDVDNETAAGRLITNLAINDANQLCFSGDFNGGMTQGNHAGTFQIGSDA